ncbi:hypothetical protein COL32_26960 [Bacillus pseudomycoides]|uniref:hypothetical protein n=1 Tax=Bacillus pseudomycoides TaxID=64104 RepID=UPI000BF0CBD4|nr:hypothetical protein [Bacillus pseudomycoides]PEK70476.1 hypothetical protein CN593_05520 [Bacillus pseudomycoides]PFW93870.1 hypothetical protein COL29_12055 [Bacillus pseudomycoides]PFX37583.1 hypothetical protein COL32_26960 [Bacillus pseudomycoides]
MSKQKRREQYNWNFKKEKNLKFHDWLDAQSNISESLITLVLHFVDQYGINDVTDYEVSKQMQRDLFMKEEFYHDISALLEKANVNSIKLNNNVPTVNENETVPEGNVKSSEKVKNEVNISKEQKESDSIEQKQKDDDYLKNVDENALW